MNNLYQGILKLFIVDIALDRTNDNPQLIFESLNSTGLDLSPADLVRNYILMGLDIKEQETIYNDLWYPMERSFDQVDYTEYFNRFMRDFLTIETKTIPNIQQVYSEFKEYFASIKDRSTYEIVKKIYYYSKLYVKLAYGKEDDSEIRQIIRDINELKVEVSYPFFLELFNDYLNNRLSKEDLIAIVKLVESYVFRRAICRIPTNSLGNTFATLAREVDKSNYLESMKAAFLLKEGYTRFPLDEEFRTQFVLVPMYKHRIKNYTLRKLENFDHQKEPIDVGRYTIEHVMPQNTALSPEWISELGETWKEIHQKYLHTIGNLTLTGYNSELSDSPFAEKQRMKGGFKSSPLRLNADLAKLSHWNKEAIEKRAIELAELAVRIWSSPSLASSILEKYGKKKSLKIEVRTEEDHISEHEEFRSLYLELRNLVVEIGSAGVKINAAPKDYIAFVRRRSFCHLKFKVNWIRLHIHITSEEAAGVEGIKPDGNGRVYCHLMSPKDIEHVRGLIRMAYEKAS